MDTRQRNRSNPPRALNDAQKPRGAEIACNPGHGDALELEIRGGKARNTLEVAPQTRQPRLLNLAKTILLWPPSAALAARPYRRVLQSHKQKTPILRILAWCFRGAKHRAGNVLNKRSHTDISCKRWRKQCSTSVVGPTPFGESSVRFRPQDMRTFAINSFVTASLPTTAAKQLFPSPIGKLFPCPMLGARTLPPGLPFFYTTHAIDYYCNCCTSCASDTWLLAHCSPMKSFYGSVASAEGEA